MSASSSKPNRNNLPLPAPEAQVALDPQERWELLWKELRALAAHKAQEARQIDLSKGLEIWALRQLRLLSQLELLEVELEGIREGITSGDPNESELDTV